jgi:outer membrane protein insertion porin family
MTDLNTFDLKSSFEEVSQNAIVMNGVLFYGVKHTRRSFLEHLARPIMKAKTLSEAMHNARIVADRLGRFGIYSHVLGEISMANGHWIRPNSIDARFYVKERGRITLKTGTEIGDNEGNLNGAFIFRNVFGGAEEFSMNASFSTRISSSFSTYLSTPLFADPDHMLSMSAYQNLNNHSIYQSHHELIRGLLLNYHTYNKLGKHQIYYNLDWRNIHHLPTKASLSIRQEAGHTLKSSIGHLTTYDCRDQSTRSGYLIQLKNELAGLGGDVKFIKSEFSSQWLYPLGKGFHTSLSLRSGTLLSLEEGGRTHISDRFLLGGPTTIRGFSLHGIGPHDQRKSKQYIFF